MKLSGFKALLITVIAFAMLSCGGKKTKSDSVAVTINPSQPVVITGNFTYNNRGTDTTVTGPWFKFNVNVQNNTNENFVVVSMQISITGVDQNGLFVTVPTTYEPSINNYTTVAGDTCNYSTFGSWAPGGPSKPLSLVGVGTCDNSTLQFYASGNPDPGGTQNFHYTGTVRLIGWFGTYDNATDRFDRTIHFSTQ